MQHGPLHRRDNDPAVTDSTMFSVSTTPAAAVLAGGSSTGGGNDSHGSRRKKKSLLGRLSLSRRLPGILRAKKRPLSEAQLRKRLRAAADREDWGAVRKLIAGYEFADDVATNVATDSAIHEHSDLSTHKRGSFKQGEQQPQQSQQPPGTHAPAARRPSYGSRERRSFTGSFTGKESAAAAAAIKAAALDESSDSQHDSDPHVNGQPEANSGPSNSCKKRPNTGDNILHDVCRHRPPLDVLETLLAALRHRRGCTAAADERGRTPLHLAAATGAAPALVDALIRADPSPASTGDDYGRSPLHLAVRQLCRPASAPHHDKNIPRKVPPSADDLLEQTHQTVKILKDAMLTYPGRIDFKDEDATGYSPLDYVVEAGIEKEELIQTLIRRKEPRGRRSFHRAHGNLTRGRGSRGRSIYSASSSVTEDLQDIEILQQLEQDEIDARRRRIDDIKEAKRRAERKVVMNDALFGAFGIEEMLVAPIIYGDYDEDEPASVVEPLENEAKPDPMIKSPTNLGRSNDCKKPPIATVEEEADIYNQHMDDYLNNYMDEFAGGDLEYCEEDGFDIFQDPEEDQPRKPEGKIKQGPPIAEIMLTQDDDCFSLVSEVTAPCGDSNLQLNRVR